MNRIDAEAAERLAKFVAGARHLRFTPTSAAGVVEIREPRLSRDGCAVEREKAELMELLAGRLRGCAVWLDDRQEEIASALRPVSERITGVTEADWCGWFEADVTLLGRLVGSPEGGWACVFFGGEIPAPLPPVAPLPTEPAAVQRLLKDLDAQVAVVCELDDEYWILAHTRE